MITGRPVEEGAARHHGGFPRPDGPPDRSGRVSEPPGGLRLRVGILSSWPLDPGRGSGTARAVEGLVRGLEALGHHVRLIGPEGGGHLGLVPRLFFNAALRSGFNAALRSRPASPRPPHPERRALTTGRKASVGGRNRRFEDLDLLVGIDFDGVLLRPEVPYIVSLKGVAADEARWESGTAALRLRTAAFLESANARKADRVVVPSGYAAETASLRYGIPEARIAVVPEAVTPLRGRTSASSDAVCRHDRPTILSVAHQYPRKRTDVLLRAIPPLARRVPEVRVRIAGDGPELPRLRRLAASLGISDRVTFLGRIPDARLAEEYSRAHGFCLPSEQEAFGVAVGEAMAAGLPVVVARAAALPEVVEHGVEGLLVEPGRPEAFADALARILNDPAEAARMGRSGRRRAVRRTPVEHARAFLEATVPTALSGTPPVATKG